MHTIKLDKRDLDLHSLTDLRNQKMVPGVINQSKNSTPIMATMNEVMKAQDHKNEIFKINGLKDMPKAMLSEVQVDPVTKQPIHFNLRTFDEGIKNVEVTREVPLIFSGKPEWMSAGHVINRPLKTIQLVGSLDKIPNEIEIDISSFTEDYTMEAKDLKLKKGLSLATGEEDKTILSFTKKELDTSTDTNQEEVPVMEDSEKLES